MAKKCVINVDLADLFKKPDRKGYIHSLAWGDSVEVLETTEEYLRVRTAKFTEEKNGSILPETAVAYICPPKSSGLKPRDIVKPEAQNKVLKVNCVDVQQGDGAVIESPDGKIILVDGGENQLFARYLAARFLGTSEDAPKKIDGIIVTHGDSDHLVGLTEIFKSESNKEPRKKLFIAPERVFHNGIVKRPGKDAKGRKIPPKEQLGPTRIAGGETILTGLVEDLLDVDDSDMNKPFLDFKNALTAWNTRVKGGIRFKRLTCGDQTAFKFFNQAGGGPEIAVYGPVETTKGGVSGLKFLGKPPSGQRPGDEVLALSDDDFKGLSVSHTINGHSVVFRLSYGGFSYLFTGDLNDQAGRILGQKHDDGELNLRSEIYKVPHHGSADFSGAFLKKVSPVVSIISCGDDSQRQEYIHPRATLLGALGRYSRLEEPLIFVTELVAFFKREGKAVLAKEKDREKRGAFFGFSRAAYGIVKTRTDGQRLLVYTDSGKANLKEAYCYKLDGGGVPVPDKVVRV